MWWITFVGFGVGLCVSWLWIFPAHVVDMKLVHMTMGDLFRILAGLLFSSFLGAGACAFVDAHGVKAHFRHHAHAKGRAAAR